jgi:hypothetical protein
VLAELIGANILAAGIGTIRDKSGDGSGAVGKNVTADLLRRMHPTLAAASASRSEPEYAVQSPVDFVHEGCRRVTDRFLKVILIEGDEGGDVDD